YSLILATSGAEAVNQFAKHPPDLVLLDLRMPDKDGWQAFDEMERLHPFVPVIVITAKSNQQGRAAGKGVDVLMEKPLDLPVLVRTIKKLLAESEQERVVRLTARDFSTTYFGTSR